MKMEDLERRNNWVPLLNMSLLLHADVIAGGEIIQT